MITDAVFAFFRVILSGLNFLLPSWNPLELSGFIDAITNGPLSLAFELLRWADWYMPVSEAVTIATLGITLFMAAILWRVSMKLGRTTHLFGGSR